MTSDNTWRVEAIGKELFECLMNRIYNANDFERLQKPSERERSAIDGWLDVMEERNGR